MLEGSQRRRGSMPAALHTHSCYSLLEGVSGPEVLLSRAAAGGYQAVALTDANNLLGAVAFADAAVRHGVRPLLGACLRQGRTRCLALAADRGGYANLCRVLSRLHLQTDTPPDRGGGPPGLPELQGRRGRLPPQSSARLADLLRDHAGGLHVLADDVALAARLREAFAGRLWLEVIRPRRGGERHEAELLACGRRLGLPPVASAAAHFAG